MAIYKTDDGAYVISSRHQWLPGAYDSERTAKYAFRFPDEVLRKLTYKICNPNTGKTITMDDLRKAREEMKGAGG